MISLGSHIAVIVSIAFFSYVFFKRLNSNALPLPPGPKKLPLIGNLLDMPNSRPWLTYAKWSREYKSDIIHLNAAGRSVIVLNSAEIVNELLEKKSSIYSSRPQLPMLHDLMGWKTSLSFAPYGARWREQRKIFTQAVNPSDPTRYFPKQMLATHELLRRLLLSSDVLADLRHWSAVLIMDITYGISGDAADPYIATAMETLKSMATAAAPGSFMVDALPILKYVPEWVPGAGFKIKARKWKVLRQNMAEKPYTAAKQQIATGVYRPSLVSSALENIDVTQDIPSQESVIKGAAVSSYGGGSDTVVSAVSSFILAMLLHPDVQARAHAELDAVLGHGDLPTFSDESSLPYITALVREILRHNPVTPLAIPHSLTADDTHGGYRVPKGSIVLGNVWSILHDEEMYPDPWAFNPCRFLDPHGKLDPTVKDPATAAFGFGRRTCPGRHVALGSIWIAVASILAAYNLTKEVDADGMTVEPSGEWVSGPTLFNHPLPFKCTFTPRSKAAEASIRATANQDS